MAEDMPQVASTGIDYGPLLGSLGFLLRLAQLASFEEFYESLPSFGMSAAEFSVVLLIGQNPGIRQGVLAQNLMIKRAHMTKMIRALEDAGHVQRTIPDDDRRSVELRLTDKGAELMAHNLAQFTAFESRGKESLNKTEEAELRRLLRKYLRLPEEDPA